MRFAPLVALLAAGAWVPAAAQSAVASSVPPEAARAADAWLESLSLREKIAQLVVTPFFGEALHSASSEYGKLRELVEDQKVGGLILVNQVRYGMVERANPYTVAGFLNRMQRLAAVPLLVGGDFERGPSMRVEATTLFPHAMAFAATGDPELTRYAGQVTARESRAVGVHWVFAPVADVNNNPENPVINIRSFGENPETVAAHVAAFLEGLNADPAYPVLTTVKHFPGHGDTDIDSHLALPTLTATSERIDQVEFAPFRMAIAQGVDAVMTAHVSVPALGARTTPGTLSPAVLNGALQGKLGFQGLTVTDALNMGAIVRKWGSAEAAVMALEAGADILLMPPEPGQAIDAVADAVARGRLTEERITASVRKMLAAKAKIGLDRERFVDIEAIADHLPDPDAADRAREISERAVTLLRNDDGALGQPFASQNVCAVVLLESRLSRRGLIFEEQFRRRRRRTSVSYLTPAASKAEVMALASRLGRCNQVVVASFADAVRDGDRYKLPGEYPALLEHLAGARPRVYFVALGNPYALQHVPRHSVLMTTYSFTPTAEMAAVRALFREVPIGGRLPVSIPGVAKQGEGIRLPAR